jgi:hypothetical protein
MITALETYHQETILKWKKLLLANVLFFFLIALVNFLMVQEFLIPFYELMELYIPH